MSRVCPGLGPKQCPTCRGAHEAWSIFCRAPAIVDARRRCVHLRAQGVSWANVPCLPTPVLSHGAATWRPSNPIPNPNKRPVTSTDASAPKRRAQMIVPVKPFSIGTEPAPSTFPIDTTSNLQPLPQSSVINTEPILDFGSAPVSFTSGPAAPLAIENHMPTPVVGTVPTTSDPGFYDNHLRASGPITLLQKRERRLMERQVRITGPSAPGDGVGGRRVVHCRRRGGGKGRGGKPILQPHELHGQSRLEAVRCVPSNTCTAGPPEECISTTTPSSNTGERDTNADSIPPDPSGPSRQ